LREAIASVETQTVEDWEMVIVDDHSTVSMAHADMPADPRIKWHTADGIVRGASSTRNRVAELAQSDLLLPLDADDKLASTALEHFLDAWASRDNARIIYPDVVMFGQDFARVYLSPEYDFETLLRATFMLVDCLHLKSDWESIGGWRVDMELGLEDWEYWIALGEVGVCGKRVPEPLYWYRRHAGGRLAALKSDPQKWHRAYQRMRDLHRETYNGRYPMGCCGGSARPVSGRRNIGKQPPPKPVVKGNRVPVAYVGARADDFYVTGQVSRVRYHVPGRGEILTDQDRRGGVDPRDVQALVTMNRSRDFKKLDVPKPAPPPKPRPKPAQPKNVTPATSEAWQPDIMVGAPGADVPDPSSMTVKEVKALDGQLTRVQAIAMLRLEVNGKARKGITRLLEAIIDELT